MKEVTVKNTHQLGTLLKVLHSYGHSGPHKVNMDMTDKGKLTYSVEVNIDEDVYKKVVKLYEIIKS